MVTKRLLGISVYQAAQERIKWTFDTFQKIYVSFSGGKDSTVMTHMVMEEAIKRNRKVGLMYIDFEAQYKDTINHVRKIYTLYADHIDPYWIAVPIHLRNSVSVYDPFWICWDETAKEKWVRQPDPKSITDRSMFPFYRYGMEFEDFVPEFGYWYSKKDSDYDDLTACFVGIRAAESLNRWRTIAGHGTKFEGRNWCSYVGKSVWNVYPIYDWKTQDLWAYHATTKKPYNHIYDLMYQAGLTIHQARLCQPYGDDQKKGLWLFHVLEPETWAKVVARVNGANSGSMYSNESGNINGRLKIELPPGHTWKSFSEMLLDSMPAPTQEHYKNKIAIFLRWWKFHGYPDDIPDVENSVDEANRDVPSWRRICKVLLRNDWWCRGLSFDQTKPEHYEKYLKMMKLRRDEWKILN
ncbi:MAG: DUF3440 domain-containing protein [Anaerolineaceae bacterium]